MNHPAPMCVTVASQSLIGPADTPAVLMQTASDLNTLARTGRKTGRLPEHIRSITDSGATLHRMIAKPAGQLLLRQFASGQGEDYLNGIHLVEHECNLSHSEEVGGAHVCTPVTTQ